MRTVSRGKATTRPATQPGGVANGHFRCARIPVRARSACGGSRSCRRRCRRASRREAAGGRPACARARMAADFQAYTINPSAPLVGNQTWTGALGNDFDVNTAITIESLGVFDSSENGISGSITVRIFDLSDLSVLATATISGSGDSLAGQYQFNDITPLTLDPGSYSVVAIGFGATDPNGNENAGDIPHVTDDGAGLVSFVSSRWGNPGVDPTTTFPTFQTLTGPPGAACSGQPEACFAAGSFQYSAANTAPTATVAYAAPVAGS